MPAIRVHTVSLGCPKNRVDTERLLGVLGRGLVPASMPLVEHARSPTPNGPTPPPPPPVNAPSLPGPRLVEPQCVVGRGLFSTAGPSPVTKAALRGRSLFSG